MMSQKENFFRFYLTEADPWYSNAFDVTYAEIVMGCKAFLEFLQKEGKI